jgi:hypothetical protein
MSATQQIDQPYPLTSPMILSDRLLSLAEAAERAGFTDTADDLVRLAHRVFDEKPQADA